MLKKGRTFSRKKVRKAVESNLPENEERLKEKTEYCGVYPQGKSNFSCQYFCKNSQYFRKS